MDDAYENDWEYLTAELAHLHLLIRREVTRWRSRGLPDQPDIFRGVFISEGEVDQLIGEQSDQAVSHDDVEDLQNQASLMRAEIGRRRRATLERGTYLSLPHLAYIFGLTPFEEQVVLIALAPEIDLRYEKLFAYLQDDVTRKTPSVQLVLKLLCASGVERLQGRVVFSAQATLFSSRLLHYQTDTNSYSLARGFKLDERIVGFLLGTGGLDKQLSACFKPLLSAVALSDLRWPDDLKTSLLSSTQEYLQSQPQQVLKLIYDFYGPVGTGRKSLAAGLCREVGLRLLIVDLREVLLRHQNFEEIIYQILREAVLQPGAVYLEHFDLLLGDDDKTITNRQHLIACLERFSWLTFISTEEAWEPAGLLHDHLYNSVKLPMPDMETRTKLWPVLAGSRQAFAPEVAWDELAVKFCLTPGQMRDALVAARNSARLRACESSTITMDDLYKGCRAQSNRKLSSSARKLTPRHSWPDIVLPQNGLAQLREVCSQLKHRQKVYGEWGFGRKLSLAKGLCVLFYGPSGTGKTTAIEILAEELQLEAYKIDLSTVVSKYIGETEKNLSAIFHEAETSNAILFFDEADALFGKRSEVKDAHDRYANIEINYLLQRIEEFEGLVVLATNLRKNIDEAFFRRMHFAIEFPFPNEGHRYQIWKQHFPQAAPVADDIDFNFLANRLHITGGNIKNIVVNAAFLAAENSGVIHMKHLVRAAKREYEKIGRLCTEAEFAPYHSLLMDS
jgi:SpoVK/Ycf46/Vps4 family AAA+-type ATPase